MLVRGQLEHEVVRESLDIPLHRLNQNLGFDAVERGKVAADHDPMPTDYQYRLFDVSHQNRRICVWHTAYASKRAGYVKR
jgi:hypothetical protein